MKSKKKTKKQKVFHLLRYVVRCSPKIKKFKTIKAMNDFILEFEATKPNSDDYWVDFAVTNIHGEALALDDTCGL